MIILLEGADCSGKTTLAEHLRIAIPEATYVHHDQNTNSVREFSQTLNDAVDRQTKTKGAVTIIDRLWISEMVYGPIMRSDNRDPDGIVARLCHMHGVITVMCVRRDIDKHIKHFNDVAAGREEYARAKIVDVINAYYDLWNGRNSVNMRYNMRPLYAHLTQFTPLKMLRSYYQYDMDKYGADQFVNWLLRLVGDEHEG